MPTLPQLSGREAVRAFESLGWKVVNGQANRKPHHLD